MNNEKLSINALMSFLTALIGLVAVVVKIIDSKLEKARGEAHKRQIVSGIIWWMAFILLISAVASRLIWNSGDLELGLLAVAVVLYCISFLRIPLPPSRLEIVALMIWVGFLVWAASTKGMIDLVEALRSKH